MAKFIVYVMAAILGVGLYVPIVLLDGWVMHVLWNWFMVATFGLPALGVLAAVGVSCCICSFVSQSHGKDDRSAGTVLMEGLLRPFMFLVIGAAVHFFM